MAKQKETWNPEENRWYQAAEEAAGALRERPAFSYTPQKDPLYQAAKEQTLSAGRRAMEDTLGKAAGLTGGYSSSYAQSLGTQAYDRQLARLQELLPDYYAQARNAYDRRGDELQDELSTALGLYDKAYQVWLENQAAQERQQAADTKSAQWEKEFQEDQKRWTAEHRLDEQKLAASQAGSAAEKERSYAYRMAMQALQQGISVSDKLLKAAGIDGAYAESLRRYYAYLRQK